MVTERMKLMCKHPWVVLATVLSMSAVQFGCVSTEELYAEYDESLCVLVPEQSAAGDILLREKISDSLFHWEPAVYFDFDDESLTEETTEKLISVLPVLKRYPHLLLSLQGFTDSTGSIGYNQRLANRRVVAVSEFMASQGVEDTRLVVQTLGEGLKTVGESSEVTRAVNRRVELMLLDSKGKPISLSVDPESILLRYLKNSTPASNKELDTTKPAEQQTASTPLPAVAVPQPGVTVNSAIKTLDQKTKPVQSPTPAAIPQVPTPNRTAH